MIYDIIRWYGIIHAYPLYWIFFKRKTYYEDKADFKRHKKQGAMVICNHFNVFDYMMAMFFMLPRKLYIIASEYSFRNKLISFGMRFYGGIETNRNSKSLKFMDESIALIKKGKLVEIFPEGHNTPDGEIHEFKPSYILIALRADSVIIPIVTDGNYGFFRQAHLLVGKAIYLSEYGIDKHSSKEEILEANEKIRQRVIGLKAQLDSLSSKGNK